MSFSSERISYRETGAFTRIVVDYLEDAPALRNFYDLRPDIEGIKTAVTQRAAYPVNRQLLVNILQQQYQGLNISQKLDANVNALLSEDTFTVCTAHQPNIFTGHLYFIYKILHAVKLADELNIAIPGKKFVPVYYMGSEDADLEELGAIKVYGITYRWETKQSGAVGRMKIDKTFIELIDAIEGQISVEPNGREVITALRESYKKGTTVEDATFRFVHHLFNDLGLVILLPDNRELKNEFVPIVAKELEEHFSRKAVDKSMAEFPTAYKVQAAGRDINLFYLDNHSRERIWKEGNEFMLTDSRRKFTTDEILSELKDNPEKFSPNVILRPVYQEMILPNVVFIGGGSELAYWLELKDVFTEAKAFFPVLMLRNSFTIVSKRVSPLLQKLQLETPDIFHSEASLLETIVARHSKTKLDLEPEKEQLSSLYAKIKAAAVAVNAPLGVHSAALHMQALHKLEALEKKMLKAEKKKFEAEQRQIAKIRASLYPTGVLQERSDNILEYLATYGKDFLKTLYEHSQGISTLFTVITEL